MILYTRSPSVFCFAKSTSLRREAIGALRFCYQSHCAYTPCACHPRTQCSARSEGSAHGGSKKSDFCNAQVTFLKKIYIRSGGWRLRRSFTTLTLRSRMTAQGALEQNKQPDKLKFSSELGCAETLVRLPLTRELSPKVTEGESV